MPYYIGSNCAGFTVLPTSLPQHKLRVESQIRKSMGSKLPEFGFPALCIGHEMVKQVKPGFTNYQPQPKYSWALSKIEGKGKLGKTRDL